MVVHDVYRGALSYHLASPHAHVADPGAFTETVDATDGPLVVVTRSRIVEDDPERFEGLQPVSEHVVESTRFSVLRRAGAAPRQPTAGR